MQKWIDSIGILSPLSRPRESRIDELPNCSIGHHRPRCCDHCSVLDTSHCYWQLWLCDRDSKPYAWCPAGHRFWGRHLHRHWWIGQSRHLQLCDYSLGWVIMLGEKDASWPAPADVMISKFQVLSVLIFAWPLNLNLIICRIDRFTDIKWHSQIVHLDPYNFEP